MDSNQQTHDFVHLDWIVHFPDTKPTMPIVTNIKIIKQLWN